MNQPEPEYQELAWVASLIDINRSFVGEQFVSTPHGHLFDLQSFSNHREETVAGTEMLIQNRLRSEELWSRFN